MIDKRVKTIQDEITRLEAEYHEIKVLTENTREKLLGILIEKGVFKYDSEFYDLRNEYLQLHLIIHVMGRKANTNVMIINMGMSWEQLEYALFKSQIDPKHIKDCIAVLKADFERVKKMFRLEYVKEIKIQNDEAVN